MAVRIRILVLTIILMILMAGISVFVYAASQKLYSVPYTGGTFVFYQAEEVC